MSVPTQVQKNALDQLRDHRVLFQFTTGELTVAPGNEYQLAKVIDLDGQVHPYSWYMALRKQYNGSAGGHFVGRES
jgi:hypothetical protein